MNSSLFPWLALFGITGLAIFLYLPRRFSGPLTELERSMAHRGRTRRSFTLVLVTPLATIVGLLLLVRQPVALEVRSRFASPSDRSATTAAERPLLASISWHESASDWVSAALCAMDPHRSGDDAALAEAILAAAHTGFAIPEDCDVPGLTNRFTARDFRGVELSLVELAARVYTLTDVEIHAGPRLQDPDPWDIMVKLLRARGLTPRITSTRAASEEDRILRLGRARVLGAPPNRLEVLALVRAQQCREYDGNLVDPAGGPPLACTLRDPECSSATPGGQRVLSMIAECPGVALHAIDGFRLTADDGEVTVNTGSLEISAPPELQKALDVVERTNQFSEELRRHGLKPLVTAAEKQISITLSEEKILVTHSKSPATIPQSCTPPLDGGPISWSGLGERPDLHHSPGELEIRLSSDYLTMGSPDYDPAAFVATLYTITWAANVLHTGRCLEHVTPVEIPSPLPAHPVLSTRQMDEAVAGMRRGRETLGLLLIAFAVLTLALGLRRSVI